MYLQLPQKIFNMPVLVEGPADLTGFPSLYTHAYNCLKASIGDTGCIIVEPSGDIKLAQTRKMIERIQEEGTLPCLLASPHLSAFQRQSLSEHGVAWIKSADTFHIPFLAAASAADKKRSKLAAPLSLGAQRIAVRIIDGSWHGMTSTELAERLGKSLSSVSNYLAEIATIDETLIGSHGRTRFLRAPQTTESRIGCLNKLEPYLSSPVKKRLFLVADKNGLGKLSRMPLSGVSALSMHTMLADDPWETRAVSTSDKAAYGEVLQHSKQVTRYDGPNALLEVWRYEPRNGSESIDEVSLYLALKEYAQDEHDDRLDDAITQYRERILQ